MTRRIINMSTELKINNTEMGTKLHSLLSEIDNELEKQYPESALILFGSYARGDAREESDLDICILVPELTERRIDMNVEIRLLIKNACRVVLGKTHQLDTKLYTYDEFEDGIKHKSTLQHAIWEEGVLHYDKERAS